MKSLQTTHKLQSIDDVINVLGDIINDSEKNHNPLGYFAVIYQKVTKKIKEGIENGFFDDGNRMEKLDIVFAERYLEAYHAYQRNEPLTAAWKEAFDLSLNREPIVLQNLLVGINTHITLDLGIAAAKISRNGNIDDLENDFFKVNELLSILVDEVEASLSGIWPVLRFIFDRLGKINNLFVDFTMRIARANAWKFAKSIVNKSENELPEIIANRDRQTAQIANWIGKVFLVVKKVIEITKMRERGSVSDKIQKLRAQNIQAYGTW